MNWLPEPEAWLSQYETDGYVIVENAVDPATLKEMQDALERVEREVAEGTLSPKLRRWVATERDRTQQLQHRMDQVDNDSISVVMELPLFDPVFSNLIIYPRVLDVLEALFESSEFSFHNYKAICKMAGNKAPFLWHRDLPYLEHSSPNLITCMLCLDDMTVENGATVVCPGSHRIAHEDVPQSDVDISESAVPENRVTVECPAGSAVLFHVNVVHGGGPNLSQTKRRNVISIWAGPETYPVTEHRYAYEFVMPRSTDPKRQKQTQLTFQRS